MRQITLASPTDFPGFRTAARRLAMAGIDPSDTHFSDTAENDLFASDGDGALPSENAVEAATFRISRRYVELAEHASLHRDADRFDLLYRLLWRLRTQADLMALESDPDVARVATLAKAVRRDIHKMHAFVRFRRVDEEGRETFVAWYEPDHYIVEAATPFFARRFATMDFAILTLDRCAWHRVGAGLTFGPGADRSSAPQDDELEDLWRRYYASTFNPARPKPDMMRREMPQRFWKNLPEAELIAPLLAGAERRAAEMIERAPTVPVLRKGAVTRNDDEAQTMSAGSLDDLRSEAKHCKLCPLWEPATQTVFGEGGAHARVMLVGEQPGDQEDLAGHPFVGPAGQVLDRALEEAGITRTDCYVTNAVKHFKFEPRGKRRIHKKPSVGEIRTCSTWLERELALIKPKIIVMLGASAAQAVLRRTVTISRERGQAIDMGDGRIGYVTVHPSYILRLPDKGAQDEAYADLVRDLRMIKEAAGLEVD